MVVQVVVVHQEPRVLMEHPVLQVVQVVVVRQEPLVLQVVRVVVVRLELRV